MQIIPLEILPNQNLSIEFEKINYNITVNDIGQLMAITIKVNGVSLVDGKRCVNNSPILYKRAGLGNFVFFTVGEVYPSYLDFGVSCALVYMTEQELINAGF